MRIELGLKKISLLKKEVTTTHIQNFLWSARRERDKPLAFSYRQRKRKCHGRDIKHYITQCARVCVSSTTTTKVHFCLYESLQVMQHYSLAIGSAFLIAWVLIRK